MSANVGRAIEFAWGDASPQTVVAGVQEKGIQLNGDAVDVTADDSDGWRTLLSVAAEDQVTISLSGVTKEETLRKDWFDGNRLQDATITYQDGATITGKFFMQSYSDTGPYNDATTFEAELLSSGVITYTPAA